MAFELTGKLISRTPTQEFGNNGFTKRTFVLEVVENPLYPQEIEFQLHKEKTELIEAFSKNQLLTVAFNIRGRRYQYPDGKTVWFNELVAWKIEPYLSQSQPQPQPTTVYQSAPKAKTPAPSMEEVYSNDDDLPF